MANFCAQMLSVMSRGHDVQSFVAVDTKGKVLSIAINVKWWSEQGVLYGIIWCYMVLYI